MPQYAAEYHMVITVMSCDSLVDSSFFRTNFFNKVLLVYVYV